MEQGTLSNVTQGPHWRRFCIGKCQRARACADRHVCACRERRRCRMCVSYNGTPLLCVCDAAHVRASCFQSIACSAAHVRARGLSVCALKLLFSNGGYNHPTTISICTRGYEHELDGRAAAQRAGGSSGAADEQRASGLLRRDGAAAPQLVLRRAQLAREGLLRQLVEALEEPVCMCARVGGHVVSAMHM